MTIDNSLLQYLFVYGLIISSSSSSSGDWVSNIGSSIGVINDNCGVWLIQKAFTLKEMKYNQKKKDFVSKHLTE